MSTGEWFTLRPLNFVSPDSFTELETKVEENTNKLTQLTNLMNFTVLPQLNTLNSQVNNLTTQIIQVNNRINPLEIRMNDVENKVNNHQTYLNYLDFRLTAVEASLSNEIRPKLVNLTTQLTTLDSRVSTVENNVNGILQLFQPVSNFTTTLSFTNGISTKTSNITIAWYKLHRFDSGAAIDFDYYLVIARGLSLYLTTNGVRWWSDQLDYPFTVNSDFWRSINVIGSPMFTKDGRFDFEPNWGPPKYRFGVMAIDPSAIGYINNDSFWFIIAIV